ncbi:hypothetical protein [Novosphingobium sp.]|uniref:hypothetical protein n=1 Tax=Novosphingobium sp. TaxID=1874826 RepID=UPI00286A59A4|nr:hypothetical protein [Novosphingobium sp.]
MQIAAYLDEVRHLYKSCETTEHGFRPALARLFQQIDPELTVINEPKRLVDVGAPAIKMNRNGGKCDQRLDPNGASTYRSEQLRNMQAKVGLI